MKLGLFGGTFNPIHFGHIQVAIEVQRLFCFDRIYFIPSRDPPHKSNKELVEANSRCEMILKSIPDKLPFKISYVEINRKGPSYSIDTVRYFKYNLSYEDRLYFIMGIDAFLEFHTWKSYKNLAKLTELIIVSRHNESIIDSEINSVDLILIKKYISTELFPGLNPKNNSYEKYVHWEFKNYEPIRYFRLKVPNISSSLVRNLIKSGEKFDNLVPLNVAEYIRKKGLYL